MVRPEPAVPKVIIPPPYQGPTRGVGRIQVEGATLRACLEAVEKEHPGFLAQVVDGRGAVHRFVRLFVNGERVDEGDLARSLEAEDELEIVAAIAGGR
jgi:sulfur carrier protein ThiS